MNEATKITANELLNKMISDTYFNKPLIIQIGYGVELFISKFQKDDILMFKEIVKQIRTIYLDYQYLKMKSRMSGFYINEPTDIPVIVFNGEIGDFEKAFRNIHIK